MPGGFDALSFLNREFGTPERVLRFLGGYGARRPGRATVRKWFERGAVPGAWLPVLLAHLEAERGGPVSLLRYIEPSRVDRRAES